MSNEVTQVYSGTGLCPALGYAESGEYKGWVFAKHPDGQWVTVFEVPEKPHTKEQINSADAKTNNDRLQLFVCEDCRAAEKCIIAIDRNEDLCYDLRKQHKAVS